MSNQKVCDLCDDRLDDGGIQLSGADVCAPCQSRPITDLVRVVKAKRQATEERREQLIEERHERARQRRQAEVHEVPLGGLRLSARAYKYLSREGIQTIGQLTGRTPSDLLGIRNFGAKCLAEVQEKLAMHHLELRGDEAP
jgi:DNA-directed RNA polymerase alpha subunit